MSPLLPVHYFLMEIVLQSILWLSLDGFWSSFSFRWVIRRRGAWLGFSLFFPFSRVYLLCFLHAFLNSCSDGQGVRNFAIDAAEPLIGGQPKMSLVMPPGTNNIHLGIGQGARACKRLFSLLLHSCSVFGSCWMLKNARSWWTVVNQYTILSGAYFWGKKCVKYLPLWVALPGRRGGGKNTRQAGLRYDALFMHFLSTPLSTGMHACRHPSIISDAWNRFRQWFC